VEHYRLPVGLLRVGDAADFIQVADLRDFRVLSTWIDGQQVAANAQTLLPKLNCDAPNQFLARPRQAVDFEGSKHVSAQQQRVIRVFDGEIVTGAETITSHELPNVKEDVLRIVVLNRYVEAAAPALGWVRGFGLERGALASSVAHDSHNIVAVGTSAAALAEVINAIIAEGGGIAASNGAGDVRLLGLPIGGLMSQADGWVLAQQYAHLDAWVKSALGCRLRAPFMSLSFLALPVIPALKMTDLGLFDVEKFDFTSVEI
jgi:adenine deaminase